MLDLSHRADITGNQGTVNFVSRGAGPLKINTEIDPAARESRCDAFPDNHFQRRQLLTQTEMNVEVAIIHGLDLDRDREVVAAG